jgi:adenosine deaminase CECR1
MPKGALLHIHLDATVDHKYLLELALNESSLHVRTPYVVTATNSATTQPEFRPFKEVQLSHYASVTDATYPGNIWVPLHKARSTFTLGGREGFDRWVIGAMSINPAEAYGTHNSVTKVQGPSHCFFSYARLTIFSDMGKVHQHL